MVVLESTTYPGTTRDKLLPALEQGSGLKEGKDFLLAFSPEREDPGNLDFETATIPRVVGGDDPITADLATRVKRVGDRRRDASDATPEIAELQEKISAISAFINYYKI